MKELKRLCFLSVTQKKIIKSQNHLIAFFWIHINSYFDRKALKRLKLISSENDRDSAEQEIKNLKTLNNENVIKYLDSFMKILKDDDENETFQYYIVTDYFKVTILSIL